MHFFLIGPPPQKNKKKPIKGLKFLSKFIVKLKAICQNLQNQSMTDRLID